MEEKNKKQLYLFPFYLIKYFFLGLINFPSLFLQMIKHSIIGIKTILKLNENKQKTGDELLLQAKI